MARRQHCDFFLTLGSTNEYPAKPTRTWSTGDWIRRADADHDSFRSALEWSLAQEEDDAAVRLAAALWRYWWWARPMEGCGWLERALAKGGPASPERLEARIGLGFLLPKSGRGSAEQGEEQIREALRLAIEAGAEMAAARARYFLAELMSRRAPDEAERLLQEALEAFQAMAPRSPPPGATTPSGGWPLPREIGDGRRPTSRMPSKRPAVKRRPNYCECTPQLAWRPLPRWTGK